MEFVDDLTIRRTTTLEVDTSRFTRWGDQYVLPIALHDQDITRWLTVSVDGIEAPTLTPNEAAAVLADGWARWSQSADNLTSIPLERRYELILAFLADGESAAGTSEVECRFLDAIDAWLTPYLYRRLIAAVVPASIAHRRIVEEIHLEPMTVPRSGLIPRRRHHHFDLLGVLLGQFPAGENPARWSVRIGDFALVIPALEPVSGRHFQLEVSAPAGTYIDPERSVLIVTAVGDGDHLSVKRFLDFDRELATARFSIDPVADGLTDVDVIEAAGALVIRPRYRYGLRTAAWVSVLTTVIQITVALTVAWDRSWDPVVHVELQPEGDAVVAVLMLVPALALLVLIREDEHPITNRVMQPTRRRLAALLVGIVAVALLVGLGVRHTAVGWIAAGICLASMLLTGLTVVSAWISRSATNLPPG